MIGPVNKLLSTLQKDNYLHGGNVGFLEGLYAQYRDDPASVDDHWRELFARLERQTTGPAETSRLPASLPEGAAAKQSAVLRLINAYRVRGHQHADTDPLGAQKKEPVPDLSPEFHGLTPPDLELEFNTGSLVGPDYMRLKDILELVESTYCGAIGAEYMYIEKTEEKRWIQSRLEPVRGRPQFQPEFRREILESLTTAEGIEKYLHTKYVGQKRFSLEGGESLIPLLDEIIQRGGKDGIKEIVLGMAHRGRLNVLINILGKSPRDLFSEFEGKHDNSLKGGDVKYHQGFSSDIETPGGPVHIAMAFNPSHLEIVSPVVEGSVKARQVRRGDRTGDKVLPVVIHGDAAFAGQGVVMETLNLSNTRGYGTGGTLHVIVNNQIGFTTSNPLEARSTHYCTEVAKMVQAPIFHVNGDDPDAVLFVTQIALDYRMQFHKDVVIDLVCYRRHGHNEADEPTVTQPMMYKRIKRLPTTRQIYAKRLAEEGVISEKEADLMVTAYRDSLDKGNIVVREFRKDVVGEHLVDWSPYKNSKWTDSSDTTLPIKKLKDLADRLQQLPQGFVLHPRVNKIMGDRQKMAAGELPLDWGMAETLAYASLLNDDVSVRLSGQDSGRGTFFHRHAVLFNQTTGEPYVPLRNLFDDKNKAQFLVINSLLSEEAVLGFEFGYATADPTTLVIWEAQFGDFANGAQVVIDQFISSAETKWGRLCGLTMFLPHGYEGQGPEHSSARLERFLQLCAQYNQQVCVPTTPAQFFHMLRRQMLRSYRKPLVVMTPKSLLRHKLATSSVEELASGKFQNTIPEIDPHDDPAIERIVLCSGKVYYDLLEQRRKRELTNVAIVRIEQLYPFPRKEVTATMQRYRNAHEVFWCQEEPRNQGAWYQIQHHLRACIRTDQALLYSGRSASPAPAEGYYSLHLEQQKKLVDHALSSFIEEDETTVRKQSVN